MLSDLINQLTTELNTCGETFVLVPEFEGGFILGSFEHRVSDNGTTYIIAIPENDEGIEEE
jgi:hypothetical protein